MPKPQIHKPPLRKRGTSVFLDFGFNHQVNNDSAGGRYPGWAQCFSTCSWMFMSAVNPIIRADDDAGLARYLDDVEVTIGSRGIAEQVVLRFPWIKGRTSQWWLVQEAGIEEWLRRDGINIDCVFADGTATWETVKRAIDRGSPVIIATNGLVKGGHIILIVGYDDVRRVFICKDPYGDAKIGYSNKQDPQGGNMVEYSYDLMMRVAGKTITGHPDRVRILYAAF